VTAKKLNGLSNIQQVGTGWHHSVALDKNGKVWIWGSDPAFQFKENTAKYFKEPLELKELDNIKKISCGSWHSLAMNEKGEVWGWGKNHFGMLGTNDTISRSTPVKITALKNITDIGAGCFQSIAIDTAGKIWTFGDNPTGQLGSNVVGRTCIPTQMNLDINGNLTLAKTEKRKAKPVQVKKDKRSTDMLFKILKYLLFSGSVILNIILLKKFRRSQKNYLTS
jgi:alpha-tubulin suppressor-like RCC1 family protein